MTNNKITISMTKYKIDFTSIFGKDQKKTMFHCSREKGFFADGGNHLHQHFIKTKISSEQAYIHYFVMQ